MQYIFAFIIFLFIIIFLIDALPQFYTWQSRIKIGRFQNQKDWENKVLTTSIKWLKNTPTIKLTDHSRLIFLDLLRGNYKRSAIQSWQEAALLLGLSEDFKKNKNEKILKTIQDFLDSKLDESGGWKVKPAETDQGILAYALINLEFLELQKYRKAFDETYQMILSLKGEDGTVAYKNHNKDYRFVDTIGFICPFLTTYGMHFNIPEAVELAVKQITEYQRFAVMPELNIPCHTYQIHNKIPTGLFGWGRGLGWFVIGLADTWKILPDSSPDKKYLESIIIKTANSVTEFQNENGGFNWLLFDNKARKDSSVAATLAWFFTVASEIPEISQKCIVGKQKCLQYLKSVTRRNGAIDFSQGDTKAIGIYSQTFDILPFTQGFCLRTLMKD